MAILFILGKPKRLLLVLSGNAEVEVNSKPIASLERGSFIAEISFLTGEPASADVHAKGEVIFISWKSERLKNLQHQNSSFLDEITACTFRRPYKKSKAPSKKSISN